MPLRDDLLNPIAGDNPAGANLRYDPVYDKIKEARREDDNAPQGEWQRERKVADFKTVLKLAQETLATRTKDLQLAAWITEGILHTEQFAGLKQGLDLIRGLIENFWDNLYPEAEDGDMELRAAPIEWAGTKLGDRVNRAPLTRSGYNYYQFQESRKVGYEANADSEDKLAKREAAIAEGKITADEFDKDVLLTATPKWEALVGSMDACLEAIEGLQVLCEAKFGEYVPSFGPLRTALEEVRHPFNQILQKRLEQEGRGPEPEPEAEEPAAEEWSAPEPGTSAAAAPKRRVSGGVEPQDVEDAAERLAAVAKFLRQQDGYSPGPYLLLRGYRWGELRGYGESPNPMDLVPPAGEIRQTVRRLALESNWVELLEVAETAMAQPCGRAWLDLQRYVVRACEEYGYPAIAEAIKSELRALLADLPGLPNWTLMDDTPAANGETQTWLKSILPIARTESRPADSMPTMEEEEPAAAPGEPAVPDTFELAMNAVRQGNAQQAIQMLAEDIPRQQSGRTRFQRKLQLAKVCISTGHRELARPILEDLVGSIESHRLEEWEAADIVSHPLAMLYRCLDGSEADADLKKKLYSRLSRLDPVAALECAR